MRKRVLILAVLAAITVPVSFGQEDEEFTPSGKMIGLFYADVHNSFTGGENVWAFEVNRAFLGYEYAFSRKISGRLMFDATPLDIDGKKYFSAYLRNAYLQFKGSKLLVKGGLFDYEQISMTSRFWNYRYTTRPAIEVYGMVPAVDMGIIAVYTPVEAVSVDLSVVNGRGHRDVAADTTVRFMSGITVKPASDVVLRGHFDFMGPSGRMQLTASFTAAWISETFTLGAEYMYQQNHLMIAGDNYSGISVFTSHKLGEKYAVYGRVDMISSVTPEGETDPWNLSKDGVYFIAGFDVTPASKVRIGPNFKGYVSPSNTGRDFSGIIGLYLEARF